MQLHKYFLGCINIRIVGDVVGLQHAQGAGLKPQRVVGFLLPDLTLKGWGELCAFWSEQTPGSQKNRGHCVSFYKVRGFSHRKNFAWKFRTSSLCMSSLSTWVFTAENAEHNLHKLCVVSLQLFFISAVGLKVWKTLVSLQLKTTATESTQ